MDEGGTRYVVLLRSTVRLDERVREWMRCQCRCMRMCAVCAFVCAYLHMYMYVERAFMEQWWHNMTVALDPLMKSDTGKRKRNGVFAVACFTHGESLCMRASVHMSCACACACLVCHA